MESSVNPVDVFGFLLGESSDQVILSALDALTDVDARSTRDETALMVAAYEGALQYVDVLLNRGADPLLTDGAGRTALDLAKRQYAIYSNAWNSTKLTENVAEMYLPVIALLESAMLAKTRAPKTGEQGQDSGFGI